MVRFRLNVSIGAEAGAAQSSRSLTDLIRERFEERRQNLQLPTREVRPDTPTAVLWRYSSPMEDYDDRWVPHRVVRQTAESVLVEASPFNPDQQSSSSQGNGRVRTYWVDRTELERIGFTRVRSRKTAFFTTPDVSLELVLTVEALMRLGLWKPYTEDELKQAYRRRALQVHPDAGGSEVRFVQLQEDHDRALRALRHSWWSE